MTKKTIDILNKQQLIDIAKKIGIKSYYKMNKDEFEKYYESAEANEDSKSDTKVILFLVIVVVIAMTYWVAAQ